MIATVRAFVEAILTQQTRDRTSFFFMIVLPLAIITIIGASFGGARNVEIAVLGDGATADAVLAELNDTPDVEATRQTDLDAARRDLRRFDIEAAVIVGDDNTFEFIANDATEQSFAARSVVQRVVDRVEAGVGGQPGVSITTESVGEARYASQGAFALTAAQNLVLFTFITALTASAILVRMRRTGVLRRSLSTPASPAGVVVGIGAGWMALAVIQAVIIVAVGALAFGVEWGAPVAAVALLLLFALVGTGAGLLVGAAVSSEDTATVDPDSGRAGAGRPRWLLGAERVLPRVPAERLDGDSALLGAGRLEGAHVRRSGYSPTSWPSSSCWPGSRWCSDRSERARASPFAAGLTSR